ncbi:peptidoglycan DD-metalloendopeptidase family protein [Algoriphagus halophytocola]|uniref:Peptidoglycan DD-metalloendopeptidase family protein n=1 Tax=Algoriphagus halophytocola TaxID=2991499 RepID=A0ABY6MGI0_9BACT|nr:MULTISPECIES: peptidoglycan DD-metalloendopeptidase family protein [unclassified Algoriphagus]UZD22910.1 peptidoglycan DD-metalloendopeptidase family protein [Algoriphagus sp. TR-M5]WBL44178.1 peptidoglycan DD-metalloendopeptidase family protein [Algoriphagus sp. TR-M9]
MKSFPYSYILCLSIILAVTSCNKASLGVFISSSARKSYENSLEKSGILKSKIGMNWLSKAEQVLNTATLLSLPIAINGSFKSKSIAANAWEIQMEKGASILIDIRWIASDSSRLIVDLLDAESLKELESRAIIQDSIQLEAEQTGKYILRVQPEMLGEGNFQILVNAVQTYAVFPVQGKNTASIQSFWGAARDGGARSHEGVDIFAARGTPVVAPVAGLVTSVRASGLGGKQVWLSDHSRNWRLYFAHLDSQLVSNLQGVEPGDTLGLVGNTGNARTTAPHLHFGIYDNGAFDPYPVINTAHKKAEPFPAEELPLLMIVDVDQANVRAEPEIGAELLFQLRESTPLFITASTKDWYQVKTAVGKIGYVYQSLLRNPEIQSLPDSSVAVLPSLQNLKDTLLVDQKDFKKVAELDSYEVISDEDENIYFKPKSGS